MEAGLEYRPGMTIREIDESQLVAAVAADVCMVDVEKRSSDVGPAAAVASSDAGTVSGKRKRGRPPRGQQRPAQPPAVEKEEDVCFICFDGGSLVLCDRKGCPKAYHPACIKRDEAFFQSKAKWNCGWHICSTCQKASSYMCYTCTYSSCKGCIKNADFTCLRGNTGLCGTCMRTIMLIENIGPASKTKVQVDFDDKTSWEYLFKVYWVCLKTELSLTADELINPKNQWKGDDLQKTRNLWNGAYPFTTPVGELHRNYEKGININNHMQLVNKENSLSMESSIVDKSGSLPPQEMAWATKELLEFVAYMKNGDVSVLSLSDVQDLLLDYIKRNNLRDPLQRSQVVCDSRLITLFGKARVGHIEMLKLLEYHFLINEKPNIEETVRAGAEGAVSSGLRAAECSDSQVILSSDRRRKSRINPNLNGYVAIDVHNINLLYLKRSSVENLLDDADKFHGTVVGSFVRIKISGGDQKIDAYRLVKVVGTGRAVEVYTVGSRTTDLMLEILNLDCKEIVSVDGISNQDFSEDECRRLRQTIKCGLIKPLTVSEILPKAMMLQAAKVSDVLEAEILRLSHIRDRANEMGQQKQLKECIERLEILNSPKERERRLVEIPEVHADPKMDPSYESEEDPIVKNEKKPGNRGRPRNSGRGRKIVNPNLMSRVGNNLNKKGNRAQNCRAVPQSETCLQVVSDLLASTQSRPAVVQSETSSLVAPMILPSSLPKGGETFANDAETEKLWHYQDPTGRTQGPFAMVQLRKWSSNGLFPLDLRVWRTYEQQSDSILLTDALVGRFSQELSFHQEVFSSSTNNDQRAESGLNLNQSTDTTSTDSKNAESNCKSLRDKTSSELLSTIFGSDSPSWTASVTVAAMENGQGSIQGLDVSKNSKSWTDEPQLGGKNASPPSSGKFHEIPSPQVSNGDEDEKLSSDLSHVQSTVIPVKGQSNAVKPEEKQAESEVYSSHSPGQNWGPLPMNSSSSSRWASNSGIAPEKCVEKLIHRGVDLSDMASTNTELSKVGSKGQFVENIQQASPNVRVQDSGPSWSTASSLVVGGQFREVGSEWCGYSPAPAKPSVDEWDSNVVPASSLKPTEAASDHAATPNSASVQLAQCAETHITIDADAWQPIVTEGHETEFSLVDESVSDLLAEVEAMESLGGLPSPTSRMTFAGDIINGSDHDCFNPGDGFSPLHDQEKNDALSSNGNMQLPSHLAVVHEPPPPLSGVQSRASEASTVAHEPIQSDSFDQRKNFGVQSSDTTKVHGNKKPDVSVSLWQAGPDVQPIEPSHFSQGKSSTGSHRPARHPDAYSGSVKGNTNLNQGPPAKDNSTPWGTGHAAAQHQGNIAMTSPSGNPSGPRHHNGDRSSGMRDNRGGYYQGRDSGFGRDRPSSWNRQLVGGLGNGHSFRPPPKGHRICKFYESGHCRKGASCSYWHPGT